MPCACAISSSVAWPGLQYFSTLSHKRHDFRKKKKVIGPKMCVLIFSTFFVWHISHPKKNWARYDKKCVLLFMQRSRCSCQILTKFEFSLHIFEKYSNTKFYDNASRGSRVVPCGQMDGRTNEHDEANSRFSKFCERVSKWRWFKTYHTLKIMWLFTSFMRTVIW